MKFDEYLLEIENFLEDYLNKTRCETYVLGLSGGVDSSLVAGIIRKKLGKEKLTCIMMPIDSHPSDLEDAIKVANALDINYLVIDGSEQFHKSLEQFDKLGIKLDTMTRSNLKVRIRMTILYAYAQHRHGLVVGTDNMDERYTGYFTKYGDGAADILPIVYLTKGEVVEAAIKYGVPPELARRTPTAGLFEGQTDETEMGITYADLDIYLLGGTVDSKTLERIEHLHRISEHKRADIPTPKEYIRDNER